MSVLSCAQLCAFLCFFTKFLSVYFDFFLGQGQNLARETKCLHSLCDIFRLDPLLYHYMLIRKDPFSQNIKVSWLSLIFLLMAVTQIFELYS